MWCFFFAFATLLDISVLLTFFGLCTTRERESRINLGLAKWLPGESGFLSSIGESTLIAAWVPPAIFKPSQEKSSLPFCRNAPAAFVWLTVWSPVSASRDPTILRPRAASSAANCLGRISLACKPFLPLSLSPLFYTYNTHIYIYTGWFTIYSNFRSNVCRHLNKVIWRFFLYTP